MRAHSRRCLVACMYDALYIPCDVRCVCTEMWISGNDDSRNVTENVTATVRYYTACRDTPVCLKTPTASTHDPTR